MIGGLVGVGPVATVWEVCAIGIYIIVLLMAKSMFCELHALKIRNGTINNITTYYNNYYVVVCMCLAMSRELSSVN